MFRNIFASALLLPVVLFAQQESHITQDPIPEFKQDFEKYTEPGIAGKGMLIGRAKNGKRLSKIYSGKSLSQTEGTVAFWIKPLDWNKDTAKGNRLFFDARGNNGQMFYINSFAKQNGSNTLMATVRQDNQDYHLILPKIDWNQNEWHHIAVSYDQNSFCLYADGKLVKGGKGVTFAKPFLRYFLGGDPGWDKGIDGNSVIDEFQIFKTALEPDVIEYLYEKYAKNIQKYNIAQIQLNKTSPVIDGKIAENEYSFGGTGFFHLRTRKYSLIQSRYFLAYDKDFFYCAIQSPVSSVLLAEKTRHDDNIWEDDSVELHLIPQNGNVYQFIINSRNAVWDALNEDTSWNASNINIKSAVVDGIWTQEIAIPYSVLQTQPPSPGTIWKINIARTFQKEQIFSTIVPCYKRYSDKARFAEIKFENNPFFLNITSFGKLNSGNLDLQFSGKSDKTTTLNARLESPQNIFPYIQEKKIPMKPSTPISERVIYDTLPKDNLLNVTFSTPDYGIIYKNSIPYHSPAPFKVLYLYTDIKMQVLNVVCQLNNEEEKYDLQITAREKTSGQTVWKARKTVTGKGFEIPVGFSIANLQSGKFDLLLECLDHQGTRLYSITEEYFKPKGIPAWAKETNVGKEHTVPIPWTPTLATANSFQCFGRSYSFGKNGLLESIVSKGRELLAAPISVNINSRQVVFTKCTLNKKYPDEAHYTLEGTMKQLSILANITAEFDGFLRFDLTLTPASPQANIQKAMIEIPISREHADAFDNNQSFWVKTDLSSIKTAIKNNLANMPSFWIGNGLRGLMFGAKNLQGWHCKDLSKSMEIIPTKDSFLIHLNLVDTPMLLTSPRKISFYLQATPIKPLNKELKKLHPTKDIFLSTHYWVNPYETHLKEYVQHDVLKKLEQRRKSYKILFHYSTSHGISPFSAEWHWYGKEWHSPLPNLGNYNIDSMSKDDDRKGRNGHTYTYACLESDSFFHFRLNTFAELVKKYPLQHIYTDLAWPKICSNPEHGCAWTDDFGRRQASLDVFSCREYFKRIYRVLKEKNPNGVLGMHLLGTTRTPAENFADYLLVGEAYTHKVASKESYYDVFEPLPLKIAYAYRTEDQVVAMIKEFTRGLAILKPERLKTWDAEKPEEDRAIKHFVGYCLLNNIKPHLEYYISKKNFLRPFQAFDAEDWLNNYASLTFHPYWIDSRNAPVKIKMPVPSKVMLSSYQSERKILAVILNDSDIQVGVTLQFKDSWADNAFNMFDKESEQYKIINKQLQLKLAPREAKLLCID